MCDGYEIPIHTIHPARGSFHSVAACNLARQPVHLCCHHFTVPFTANNPTTLDFCFFFPDPKSTIVSFPPILRRGFIPSKQTHNLFELIIHLPPSSSILLSILLSILVDLLRSPTYTFFYIFFSIVDPDINTSGLLDLDHIPSTPSQTVFKLKMAQADGVEPDQVMPIAIIGMACRFPGDAEDVESLFDMLKRGDNAWSEFPGDRVNIDGFYHPSGQRQGSIGFRGAHFIKGDIKAFDAAFFNISPSEAPAIDPQQRVLLETTYQALENCKHETSLFNWPARIQTHNIHAAGYSKESLDLSETSVNVGTFVKGKHMPLLPIDHEVVNEQRKPMTDSPLHRLRASGAPRLGLGAPVCCHWHRQRDLGQPHLLPIQPSRPLADH